ncbi:MAG: hypothetical protein GY739_20410 [Mesoflavibacter sp.]|nr:hypothetical protein [Mesoflavibacter sp.]
MKSDFDDAVESSLNEEESEEDIVAEYVENEKIEEDYTKRCLLGANPEEPISLLRQVSDYHIDCPCCTENCCQSWKERDLVNHADDMRRLSKREKKSVLLTVLRNSVIHTENTRYSEQRRRQRFTFCYEPFGAMCSVAFRLLSDIRIKELKGLSAHLKISEMSIVPPQHGNIGKKTNRSNSLVYRGVSKKLIEFLLSLSESHGEYSPGRHTKLGNTKEDKNPDLLWLPASFTRSCILRMYNKPHPDFPISRTAFCSLLKNEPGLRHIWIRSSRSDMCDFCEI